MKLENRKGRGGDIYDMYFSYPSFLYALKQPGKSHLNLLSTDACRYRWSSSLCKTIVFLSADIRQQFHHLRTSAGCHHGFILNLQLPENFKVN